MKTKKKMIALVQIAVVLCSMFLVALPVVAADQKQEMQKVSASEVTTASEDDYVLGIYGNANEDDTIDMGDVVYTKLAIFGKKPKTELCDAKYDGRINVLDVIQTKLIILGKEKEITVAIPADPLQPDEQIVTVHKPVERIVVVSFPEAEALRSLNAADKIVGVGKDIQLEPAHYPELSKLPVVGTWMGPGLDHEAVLNLRPDLFLAFLRNPRYLDEEKLPGVTVIGLSLRNLRGYTERVRQLGYILDKEEEAEEYINWHEGWINKIKSRTEGLSEDEKPRVFYWWHFQLGGGYRTITHGSKNHAMVVMAGGIDVAEDLKGIWPKVDPEWVIVQNPDIIVADTDPGYICYGYGTNDPSEKAARREGILNRPELANVNAVKNGRVYMMEGGLATGGSCCLIGAAYFAKWFHPELFEDMDPKAIQQEYLTRFQRMDYDLDEHGVFVYPPLES